MSRMFLYYEKRFPEDASNDHRCGHYETPLCQPTSVDVNRHREARRTVCRDTVPNELAEDMAILRNRAVAHLPFLLICSPCEHNWNALNTRRSK